MFQRSEQSDRREARGGEVEDEAQKDAWWSPVERQAGRIIDLDAPAPQLTGDAAREVAVGGYQRRCFTRIFEALTQQKRDDAGLLLRTRAIEPEDTVQRRRVEAR